MLNEFLFTVSAAVLMLGFAVLLRFAETRFERWRDLRSGRKIQCDLCDHVMRPDGLHVVDVGLLFPAPRMFRHPQHIVRMQILKQPIIKGHSISG